MSREGRSRSHREKLQIDETGDPDLWDIASWSHNLSARLGLEVSGASQTMIFIYHTGLYSHASDRAVVLSRANSQAHLWGLASGLHGPRRPGKQRARPGLRPPGRGATPLSGLQVDLLNGPARVASHLEAHSGARARTGSLSRGLGEVRGLRSPRPMTGPKMPEKGTRLGSGRWNPGRVGATRRSGR